MTAHHPKPTDVANVPVAVIGMALRLPGASTPEELWRNVAEGRESVRTFTREQLVAAGIPSSDADHPDYVPVHGVIDGIEEFDADLFGFSPREAQLTDPQQRKFLEVAYEALEASGYMEQRGDNRIGVFAGTGSNTYLLRNVLPHRDIVADVGETASLIAAEKDHVATRTSHRLDLHGPAMTVQTSCSTSLVAVHMAVQTLLAGDADIVIAGGASIHVPQQTGHLFSPNGVASRDGKCRAFDVNASGTVFGSGVAAVVLRRLEDALDAGDTVYGVIRGSAINNDGARKVGYTAPSVPGQAAVIRAAHAAAGVSADSVSYIETHGTGTEVGDVIEVEALKEAFSPSDRAPASCVLGTLKPNIGHVDITAGVSGLIKAVLALWHKQLPPSINVTSTNPELKLEQSPFCINRSLRPWPQGGGPRRAGVSSFGLGGTNAHVVLEEAPPSPRRRESAPRPRLLPLSARTTGAVEAMAARLESWSDAHPDANLADVAYTLQERRRSYQSRMAVVAAERSDLREQLAHSLPRAAVRRPTIGFMFSGYGDQSPGMATGLYAHYAVFRDAFDECAELLRPFLGVDVRTLVCAIPSDFVAAQRALDLPSTAQPVLFSVEYALARLLMSWGLQPKAVFGHSLGEYVAACVAGALSLPDALRLVVTRATLLDGVGTGAMTAVLADESTVLTELGEHLSLAAVNAVGSVVVSGPVEPMEAFESRMAARGVKHRRLSIHVAGHSSMLDPILDSFRTVALGIDHQPLRIPMISAMTGERVEKDARLDAEYWTRHLRETVRFAQAAGHAVALRNPVLLEIGPGHALTHLVRQAAGTRAVTAVPTLPGRGDDVDPLQAVLQAVGDAWCAGAEPDWRALRLDSDPRNAALPGYPFEKQRHWLDAPRGAAVPHSEAPPLESSSVAAGVEERAEAGSVQLEGSLSEEALRERAEHDVSRIWIALLGLTEVEPDHNFFALGGNSLLLVRLIARLREDLGVSIPLRVAASAPTVRAVAALVVRAQKERHA
ncbi:type I polyketide synthase [Streptomyces yangpuensis]|uniref:type I polyketide synthase n=1 Tax=Streptomyces yangpuensis TaxID=1648182 RepID=UPI00381BF2A7